MINSHLLYHLSYSGMVSKTIRGINPNQPLQPAGKADQFTLTKSDFGLTIEDFAASGLTAIDDLRLSPD